MAVVAGLAAAAAAWVAIGPLGAATIDPDASASVLYFQRLTAGRQLEAFVPTTPKPVLTLVYGIAWSVLHEWRALVVLTIVAQAVAVALACLLAGRAVAGWGRSRGSALAGSFAAVALIAVALAVSPELLLEVAHANALVWAIAAWSAAGLALTAARPRYGIAGLALLVGALLRVETWLLIVPAVLAGAWLAARDRRAATVRPVFAHPALRLWVALLALPIGALHDLLLTGDPLFSFEVSARYTTIYVPGLRPEAPVSFLADAIPRWTAQPALLLLALVGVSVAVTMARRWIAGGIVALTLGDLALLTVLAARGTYVSARYYEVADVGLWIAAAIGAGAIVGIAVGAIGRRAAIGTRDRGAGTGTPRGPDDAAGARSGPSAAGLVAGVAGIALGLALGLALTWPPGIAEPATSSRLALVRRASEDVPRIEAVLRTLPASPAATGPGTGSRPDPFAMESAGAQVLVPSQLRSRIAVDLGWSLTRVADSLAAFLPAGPAAVLRDGQVVVHDRAADPGGTRYRPLYAPLEVGTGAAASGGGQGATGGADALAARLSGLLVDRAAGIWIVRVGPPAGG